MSSSTPPNYGAVKTTTTTDEEDATGDSFDPDQERYIRNNTSSPLSFRRFALIVTPLLGAVLIVGGAALLLLKNFSHLYPGRGGVRTSYATSSSSSNRPPLTPPGSSHTSSIPGPLHRGSYEHDGIAPPDGGDQRPPLTPRTKNDDDDDDDGRSCSSHPACGVLLGDCCPTAGGVYLSCCN